MKTGKVATNFISGKNELFFCYFCQENNTTINFEYISLITNNQVITICISSKKPLINEFKNCSRNRYHYCCQFKN